MIDPCPDKGAEVAAWKQTARAALSVALNLDYAAVLLDLTKAFQRIPHDWLVQQGCRHIYNLYLLRLSAVCTAVRGLFVLAACSWLHCGHTGHHGWRRDGYIEAALASDRMAG